MAIAEWGGGHLEAQRKRLTGCRGPRLCLNVVFLASFRQVRPLILNGVPLPSTPSVLSCNCENPRGGLLGIQMGIFRSSNRLNTAVVTGISIATPFAQSLLWLGSQNVGVEGAISNGPTNNNNYYYY